MADTKMTKNALYAVLVIILIGVLIFVLPGQMPQNNGNNDPTIEQKVVQELAAREEIKPFAGYTTTVKLLSESQLSTLQAQQPAIYGGVPVNSYEVDYEGRPVGKDNGLLVIYDYNSKEIVKMFAVQDFNI